MLEIHGDAYIFGGRYGWNFNSAIQNANSVIYKFTCSSGICSWSTLNQELKVARYDTFAIRVPDNFCIGIVISLENQGGAADFLVSTVRAVVRSEIRGGT